MKPENLNKAKQIINELNNLAIVLPKLKEYKIEVKKHPKDVQQVAFQVYGETIVINNKTLPDVIDLIIKNKKKRLKKLNKTLDKL